MPSFFCKCLSLGSCSQRFKLSGSVFMKEIQSLNTPKSEGYVYVRERAALETLIEHVDRAERVALDTEADSLHNYFEKGCLVELSLGGEPLLADPSAGV